MRFLPSLGIPARSFLPLLGRSLPTQRIEPSQTSRSLRVLAGYNVPTAKATRHATPETWHTCTQATCFLALDNSGLIVRVRQDREDVSTSKALAGLPLERCQILLFVPLDLPLCYYPFHC